MVASHCAVDDVREPALEGSASFSGRLSFGDLAPVVVLPGSDVSDLARRDDVEHAVEGSVTASVQSMPGVVAAGGFQRCAAGVAGEVMLGRKPVDVADMAEDFRSEDDAHPGQVGKRGSAGVDGISHLMFVVFDGAIEAAQVGKEVSARSRRQQSVAVTGRTRRRSWAAFSAERSIGAPPGTRSRSRTWSRLSSRVRSLTRSSRRSVNNRRIVAWSSERTWRRSGRNNATCAT